MLQWTTDYSEKLFPGGLWRTDSVSYKGVQTYGVMRTPETVHVGAWAWG